MSNGTLILVFKESKRLKLKSVKGLSILLVKYKKNLKLFLMSYGIYSHKNPIYNTSELKSAHLFFNALRLNLLIN